MAKTDIGKKWEAIFKTAWKKQLPNTFIFRLADQMSGFRDTSGNPCDFLCFAKNKLLMVECKEHKGLSIPFSAIPQYERLLSYKNLENVFPGVLVWFSEKDIIIWANVVEMEKMVKAGEKSIGIRMLKDKSYNIKEISGEKKRVFFEPNCEQLLIAVEDTN